MTHQDFKKYSIRQQVYTIHQYAHFLTLTTIGDCIIRLYELDGFFVEYKYNITTLQVSVDAFKDTDRLSLFLEEVDLSSIN